MKNPFFFQVQLKIIKHLTLVAIKLGPEATRNDLLPQLKDNLDVHDEYLLNLAEQLGNFVPLVGGIDYCMPVLEILLKLCYMDEPIVRNQTIVSLQKIIEQMNTEQVETMILPNVKILSDESWFTSKCSASSLYPVSLFNIKILFNY